MKNYKGILLLIVIIAFAFALVGCSEAYKLSFSSETYTVKTGISFIPQITVRPKKVEYQIVSDNTSIASVENNVVSSLKEGVVNLTVTSGKKSDTCVLYIMDETENVSTDIVIKDVFYITFVFVNYEAAGLEDEVYQTVAAIDGNVLNVNFPYVDGFSVDGWYLDRACTQKYDMSTAVNGAFKLYAMLSERENGFIVTDKLITSIKYKGLAHSVLEFPSAEENGGEILGINDNAFKDDTEITKVIIPNNYKIIGDSAFAGCTNLTEVVFEDGSELYSVGINAFASCDKLEDMTLSDGINTIGAYAFYQCKKLTLDGIPSGIKIANQYAFSGTMINNINFTNVEAIYEGAFKDCTYLNSVDNTEGIYYCDKYAFENTALYNDAVNKYRNATGTRKDIDALIYADTILIGCYEQFGSSVGSGKVKIKTETTLIANQAFLKDKLTELTLNIDTDKANEIINDESYDFIGESVFNDSIGVCVVVKDEDVAKFKARYAEYNNRFCSEEIITVIDDNNLDVINWGKHTLLKFVNDYGSISYYYDRFTPFDAGTPKNIFLSNLKVGTYFLTRINSNAFLNVTNLVILELNNATNIAFYAIASCPNLIKIDCTRTISIMQLENSNSIQFSSLNGACKVYVKAVDYSAYRASWKSYATAYSKLISES